MKFMIGVDLEGCACVVGEPNGTLTDSSNYQFARCQATKEANAAAKALFEMGADKVVIWDNHGAGLNLVYDELDERCDIILGSGINKRWYGLDGTYSGVLLIGYHSMDNTPAAVLAHTYSSKAYQYMKINGTEVGEIEIDAAIAAEAGVPLIFASSDEAGCNECKRFMPWAETVETKKGIGWNMAYSKHPNRVLADIGIGVKRAVERLGEMKLLEFQKPMELEIRYKRLEGAQAALNNGGKNVWEAVDPYTIKRKLERISDYF